MNAMSRIQAEKIRTVIRARQEEGTFISNVPFGYRRCEKNKKEILVNENEAFYIRKVFDLYMQGFGYRKIAAMLNEQGIPTPSMLLKETGNSNSTGEALSKACRQRMDGWYGVCNS